jgi:hypothetical protein
MKHLVQLSLALALGTAALPLQAQTASDALDQVVTNNADARSEVIANGQALKALVVDYFVNGNPSPNVDGLVAVTGTRQAAVDAFMADVIDGIAEAELLDNYVDASGMIARASQVQDLGAQITALSESLRSAILAADEPAATVAAQGMRSRLGQQISLLRQINQEAGFYQDAVVRYNVRIALVDQWGNPVTGPTGLMGYYAFDEFKGTYEYPFFSYDDNQFIDLRGVTYTFGAYPGYFEGAGTTQVKLKPELVGPDGFITVVLSYWSE